MMESKGEKKIPTALTAAGFHLRGSE